VGLRHTGTANGEPGSSSPVHCQDAHGAESREPRVIAQAFTSLLDEWFEP
jgi:hypothetical protein